MLIESNKKREEFMKKEKKILDEINELQTKYCMCPLGKDRYYRRYWIFKSLPGVFVEDDDDDDNNGEFDCLKENFQEIALQNVKQEDADAKVSLNNLHNTSNSDSNNNDGKENKPNLANVNLPNGVVSMNGTAITKVETDSTNLKSNNFGLSPFIIDLFHPQKIFYNIILILKAIF